MINICRGDSCFFTTCGLNPDFSFHYVFINQKCHWGKTRPDITLSRGVGFTTSFRRLLESIGPQNAEQNIYHGIKYGITHADLLQVRAPKPLLISSTTRDFFSIQGAVETYQEVNKAYEAFGKEGYAGQTIDDAGHGFFNTMEHSYS